jgi:hypothetical protein
MCLQIQELSPGFQFWARLFFLSILWQEAILLALRDRAPKTVTTGENNGKA